MVPESIINTLVVATGATHAYFGHDEWEQFAPGLKNLDDATTLRARILSAFEQAENTTDPWRYGLPTRHSSLSWHSIGVELSGTIRRTGKENAEATPGDFIY